jgi:hypothetical protein
MHSERKESLKKFGAETTYESRYLEDQIVMGV